MASVDIAGVGVVTLIDGGVIGGVLVVVGFAGVGMFMMGEDWESGTNTHVFLYLRKILPCLMKSKFAK